MLLEANAIVAATQKNGEEVGVRLPKKDTKEYFKAFNNFFEFSLDTVQLKSVFERVKRKKFGFCDDKGNKYTLAIVNVDFKYRYDDDSQSLSTLELRKKLYEDGFKIDGVHYVRYNRSAGSSRQGKCLFIDESLFKSMDRWSSCGLSKEDGDLVSFEAYKALSLSAIKGIVDIPLSGILFVNDYESVFEEDVVAVTADKGGRAVAEERKAKIANSIWDGESLLDESIFARKYPDKHMLLLRNNFFKSCAFRTKLQKWFADNKITSVEQLKKFGGVTFAKRISDIVMVTTPSSLKYLKFAKGGLTEFNLRDWMCCATGMFGVVKYDKRTKFFDGRVVQGSYQFFNTIQLDESETADILRDNVGLATLVRENPAFMQYYFKHLINREKDENENDADGLVTRGKILFSLINKNEQFVNTRLYLSFRNAVVSKIKDNYKHGKLFVNGTNATLFGNGPELLMQIVGKFDGNPVGLEREQVRCARFEHGKKLLCCRSPHITMGNLYIATNNLSGDVWDYFDLGENIVCVNAINENLQQRLNGCDYDSDAMLITDNPLLVAKASKYYDVFKVPVCDIPLGEKTEYDIAEIDNMNSDNLVGRIVNLSQKLNSVLWHKINENGGKVTKDAMQIYNDICVLAVLSGIEIDKAKRTYLVNVNKTLTRIQNDCKAAEKPCYQGLNPILTMPMFFKELVSDNKVHDYQVFDTAMDRIYSAICNAMNYAKGRKGVMEYVEVSDLFVQLVPAPRTSYNHRDKIIEICEEADAEINSLQKCIRDLDDDESYTYQEDIIQIKKTRDEEVMKYLWLKDGSPDVWALKLTLEYLQKDQGEDWLFYSALMQQGNEELLDKLLVKNERVLQTVREAEWGDIELFGFNFKLY